MFKHSAFVRKNTPELREKLEKLGIKVIHEDEAPNVIIVRNGEALYGNFSQKAKRPRGVFDCGENEDLFLAIAAIREDNDFMQWFRCINDDDIPTFTLCTDKKCEFPIRFQKATSEELIEYFKNK